MPKEITEDWMHLQFVGSGDAFGSGGRFNTCFHVVGKETNFLIDCGASSLIAMNRFGIDRNAIDLILLGDPHRRLEALLVAPMKKGRQPVPTGIGRR